MRAHVVFLHIPSFLNRSKRTPEGQGVYVGLNGATRVTHIDGILSATLLHNDGYIGFEFSCDMPICLEEM